MTRKLTKGTITVTPRYVGSRYPETIFFPHQNPSALSDNLLSRTTETWHLTACGSHCATTAHKGHCLQVRLRHYFHSQSKFAPSSSHPQNSSFAPPSILSVASDSSPLNTPTSYHHRHHHSQCLDRPCVSLPALPGLSLLAESSRYVLSSRIPPPPSEKATSMAQFRPDLVQYVSSLFHLLGDILMFRFSMIRHDMSLLPCSPARSVSTLERLRRPQQRSRPSSSRELGALLRKLDWLRLEGFCLSGRIFCGFFLFYTPA